MHLVVRITDITVFYAITLAVYENQLFSRMGWHCRSSCVFLPPRKLPV